MLEKIRFIEELKAIQERANHYSVSRDAVLGSIGKLISTIQNEVDIEEAKMIETMYRAELDGVGEGQIG